MIIRLRVDPFFDPNRIRLSLPNPIRPGDETGFGFVSLRFPNHTLALERMRKFNHVHFFFILPFLFLHYATLHASHCRFSRFLLHASHCAPNVSISSSSAISSPAARSVNNVYTPFRFALSDCPTGTAFALTR